MSWHLSIKSPYKKKKLKESCAWHPKRPETSPDDVPLNSQKKKTQRSIMAQPSISTARESLTLTRFLTPRFHWSSQVLQSTLPFTRCVNIRNNLASLQGCWKKKSPRGLLSKMCSLAIGMPAKQQIDQGPPLSAVGQIGLLLLLSLKSGHWGSPWLCAQSNGVDPVFPGFAGTLWRGSVI